MCALFSPEILLAAAVKGLMYYNAIDFCMSICGILFRN